MIDLGYPSWTPKEPETSGCVHNQPIAIYIYIYKRSQAGAILEQPELLPGSIEVPFSEVWKAVRLSDDPCSFSLISVRSFSQQPLVSILEGQTLQSRTILE